MFDGTSCCPGRALILEPDSTGHRPTYVRWIAHAFIASATPVLIVGPSELLRHSELEGLACGADSALTNFLEVAHIESSSFRARAKSRLGLLLNEHALRAWYGRAYNATGANPDADLVIIPYLDNCFHAIAIMGTPFGGCDWCGITMRTEFPEHDGTNPTRMAFLSRMLAQRKLKRLWSIDPRSADYVQRRGNHEHSRWQKLHYLPDPSDMVVSQGKQDARRALRIEEQSKVVLLFGSIDTRKGLEELLRGAALLSNPHNWIIIIAGQQAPEAAGIISRWATRTPAIGFELKVFPSRINAELAATLFAATDVVWTGYPNHKGMSGVLVQAAFCGRPAIAHSRGLVSELIRSSGIGLSCDVTAPREVAKALEAALDPRIGTLAEINGPRYFAHHRPLEFGERLVSTLRGSELASRAACATH